MERVTEEFISAGKIPADIYEDNYFQVVNEEKIKADVLRMKEYCENISHSTIVKLVRAREYGGEE